MMKSLLFFGLWMSVACTPGTKNSDQTVSVADTSEEKVIVRKLEQYYQVMSERNWKKYKDQFWEQATITTAWQRPGDSTPGVHIITVDEFIREAPRGPDSQPVFEERMIDSEIKIDGNLAGAWVRYEAEFGKPDSLMRWTGMDVFTWMKHKNEWRIVSLAFEGSQ